MTMSRDPSGRVTLTTLRVCCSSIAVSVSVCLELIPLLVLVLDLELMRRRRERLGFKLHAFRLLLKLA